MGAVKPIKTEPASPCYRRHAALVQYVAASGASMPLKAAFRGRLRTARPPQGNNVRKIYSQLSLFCSDLWHCGGLLLPVVLHILTAVIAVILG
jgi:hypothetical protein